MSEVGGWVGSGGTSVSDDWEERRTSFAKVILDQMASLGLAGREAKRRIVPGFWYILLVLATYGVAFVAFGWALALIPMFVLMAEVEVLSPQTRVPTLNGRRVSRRARQAVEVVNSAERSGTLLSGDPHSLAEAIMCYAEGGIWGTDAVGHMADVARVVPTAGPAPYQRVREWIVPWLPNGRSKLDVLYETFEAARSCEDDNGVG